MLVQRTHTVDRHLRNYQPDQATGDIFASMVFLQADKNARSKLLGSIAYVRSTDRYNYSYVNLINRIDSVTLENNVAYIEPGAYSTCESVWIICDDVAGSNLVADKLTGFGASKSVLSRLAKEQYLAVDLSIRCLFFGREYFQYQSRSQSLLPVSGWSTNYATFMALANESAD